VDTLTAEDLPAARRPRRALVFIGFMGAGKSAAAKVAGERLGLTVLDSDRLLEERLGKSIADAFSAGEESFRAAEEDLVCSLLEKLDAGSVLSLGGGSVLSKKVRQALQKHLTVLLDVHPDIAWRRVSDSAGRPLASDAQAFRTLYSQRSELYRSIADAILPGTPRETLPAALGALVSLSQASPQAKLLWASSASGSYPVLIGPSLLADGIWPLAPARRFCVTDETVGELYASRLGELQATITIPPGERAKTLANAERVWQELADGGMTRADLLVALGGGVVGDLAGFCAATYQRGVPVVQVPTTLLGQVDSAYGGKTGVDLPQAKNYVGAYHQAAAVIADTDTLETLPVAELACGYAEVIKTALIAGGELWRHVAADEPLNERVILQCARTKLAVVAEDERDSGRRQVLNLGHTVAHAIEVLTEYERLRHGEAVGLGLLAALRLSGQGELREQVSALLTAHGLPVTIDDLDATEVVKLTARDKKRLGEKVPFVLVNAPGDVVTGCEVDDGALAAAVSELCRS
jgi:shikimate kinase/3-dehydroquinate synthase